MTPELAGAAQEDGLLGLDEIESGIDALCSAPEPREQREEGGYTEWECVRGVQQPIGYDRDVAAPDLAFPDGMAPVPVTFVPNSSLPQAAREAVFDGFALLPSSVLAPRSSSSGGGGDDAQPREEARTPRAKAPRLLQRELPQQQQVEMDKDALEKSITKMIDAL